MTASQSRSGEAAKAPPGAKRRRILRCLTYEIAERLGLSNTRINEYKKKKKKKYRIDLILLNPWVMHTRTVTTARSEAQAYFDQGLRLTYGFNHDEAARSFAKAAALDPTCAMCFWGVALTLGPNYNVPMLPDRAARGVGGAARKAQAAAATATRSSRR